MARLVSWHSYQRDTVRLLWLPIRAANWLWFSQYGYQIDRADVVGGQPGVFEKIAAAPVLPAPASQLSGPARDAMNPAPRPQRLDSTGSEEANDQALRHLMVTLAAFESPKTAQRLGLGWADATAQPGKTYAYRIFPLLPPAQHQPGDTTYRLVSTARPTTVLPPPQLRADGQERAVELSWSAQALAQRFVLYHIERSDDGRTFHRLTKIPLLHTTANVPTMAYRDSVTANYRPYAYRLVGMTPFGEWITSPYVVQGMGRDKTPPAQPFIDAARHLGGKRVLLTWRQEPAEGDLRGFYISRASTLRGSYKRVLIRNALTLLPKTERTYTDFDADLSGGNHYMVVAVNTAGNERPSIPAYVVMSDSIPPAPPTGLTARVDTVNGRGMVTLRWRKSPEKDVQGYKVFYANDPSGPFSQRTHRTLTDSVFRDTIALKTLTKQVFYRVVALDQHYNHSGFSALLAMNRPDIVRPAAPLITEILNHEADMEVRWQASPSNDVVAYRLYRREAGRDWVLARTFRGAEMTTRQYVDKNVREGQRYDYAMQVVDNSGLESDRSPVGTGQLPEAVYLSETPTMQVRYDDSRKAAYLTWTLTTPPPYRLVIYRSHDNGPLLPITTATADQRGYLDTSPQPGRYAYVAKAVLPSGRQSRLSQRVSLRIP